MTTAELVQLTPPVGERDPTLGPATARVTVVEFGDLQCAHCRSAAAVVDEVLATLPGRVRFAWRHFPLAQLHPHAQLAAEAACAAGVQGRFWEMHHLILGDQDRLAARVLVLLAARLGLDVDRFTAELTGRVHAPKVREDFLSGIRSGVSRVPTFFVNGVRHDRGWDAASLLDAIRRATP